MGATLIFSENNAESAPMTRAPKRRYAEYSFWCRLTSQFLSTVEWHTEYSTVYPHFTGQHFGIRQHSLAQ